MLRRLLLTGDRANLTALTFDDADNSLSVTADYPAPYNVSWVEAVSTRGPVSYFVGLSEGNEEGLLFTFEVNHEGRTCNITSQQTTLGAPGHLLVLRDDSAVALATYYGGSIALYPLTKDATGIRLMDVARTEILPVFPYESVQHGPNKTRQRQCHPHQVMEDKRGLLYIPDLGSDRVWVIERAGTGMNVSGWLQCPPGTGARHAVFCPDEKIIYTIGELSHSIIAFDLTPHSTIRVDPIESFKANIIPTNVQLDHQFMMDASEILSHPHVSRVLYASNRWERHIQRREPYLTNVPVDLPTGDSIAIILLSEDGREVEEVKHIRTKLDVIRGMRLSSDGKYVAAVGQEGGGVEIFVIEGVRAEVWTLVASLNQNLESGIKHVVWL